MKTPFLLTRFVLGFSLFLGAGLLPAQTISFKPVAKFGYPGAVFTEALGMDAEGDVVGAFALPGADYANGFERYADGSLSAPLIYPGSDVYQTIPTAINNQGTITGWYETNTTGVHGFFFSNGVYTTFDYPGANITHILGINDAGDFVGIYTSVDNPYRAFASIGGQLSEITIPDSTYIEPHDINNRGAIVGWYNTIRTSSGFRIESDGTLRYPIRPPGASAILLGTNETKASVGQQSGNFALYYGGGSTFVSYTFPTLTFNSFTGINPRGLVCGYGYDSSAAVGYSYLVRRVVRVARHVPSLKNSVRSRP